MTDALLPVQQALDALAAPLTLFIRDDDAGWNDDRLLALVDCTTHAGVPIDLAAIPMAMTDALADALIARIDAAPGLIGVHQHGYAHTNHETEGRKCEFGPSRSTAQQRADLLAGRTRLRRHFGAHLQPFFTPPWNRCTPATPMLLAELGFTLLSRDRGAMDSGEGSARPSAGPRALPELAVDVDWSRHHRAGGLPAVANALAEAIAARGRDGQALGLMLHHAVMSPEELEALAGGLAAWAPHRHARWQAMAACVDNVALPAATAA